MKSESLEKEYTALKKEELILSGEVLVDLLKATLAKGLSLRFEAKGFSMTPFIKNGDVVTVAPLNHQPISIGKPAAFIHPLTKKLVIHRVIGRSQGTYLIKGDNIFEPDRSVRKENILGWVSRVERNNREFFWGAGLERLAIALLSRLNLLPLILWSWRRFIPYSIRKKIIS